MFTLFTASCRGSMYLAAESRCMAITRRRQRSKIGFTSSPRNAITFRFVGVDKKFCCQFILCLFLLHHEWFQLLDYHIHSSSFRPVNEITCGMIESWGIHLFYRFYCRCTFMLTCLGIILCLSVLLPSVYPLTAAIRTPC